jgi:proteic killer suppression protein
VASTARSVCEYRGRATWRQLLAAAADDRDIRAMRSLRMEKLVGDRAGQYSIRLNDQFRLIFRLKTDARGKGVIIIEVVDYH